MKTIPRYGIGRVSFKSVGFSSGRPARFPIVNERVTIVYIDGELVIVHSAREVSQ